MGSDGGSNQGNITQVDVAVWIKELRLDMKRRLLGILVRYGLAVWGDEETGHLRFLQMAVCILLTPG